MQSPAVPAGDAVVVHRVLSPLNWVRSPGRPLDGEVRIIMDKERGAKVYMLKAQPKLGKSPVGVSFFAPRPEYSKAFHALLAIGAPVAEQGCSVADPASIKLPPSLRLLNDGPMEVPWNGKAAPYVECGNHWTLYTDADMPAADFETAYQVVLSQMAPCSSIGSATGSFFDQMPDTDWDCMPSDKLTYAVAQALEELSNSSTCGNVRLFASLFSFHLRATDMEFGSVLQFGAIASMAQAALDAWTVYDLFLYASACKAWKLLSSASDDEGVPGGPVYAPVGVHPFEFLDGVFTDQLYDNAVRTAARAFAGDHELKVKVSQLAIRLFQEMSVAAGTTKIETATLEHCGITFKVTCGSGCGGECAGGESGRSLSGSLVGGAQPQPLQTSSARERLLSGVSSPSPLFPPVNVEAGAGKEVMLAGTMEHKRKRGQEAG